MLVYRQQKAVSGRRREVGWPALLRAGTNQTLENCQVRNEHRVAPVTAQRTGEKSAVYTQGYGGGALNGSVREAVERKAGLVASDRV